MFNTRLCVRLNNKKRTQQRKEMNDLCIFIFGEREKEAGSHSLHLNKWHVKEEKEIVSYCFVEYN